MSNETPRRTIRIDNETWLAAHTKAATENTTISETIRAHLTQWVQEPHNTAQQATKPATAPQTHNHPNKPRTGATMTLRTALEELAAKWELAGFPSKATEARAILAAHPDNSTTEWGVYIGNGSYIQADDEAMARRWVERPNHPAEFVVTHQIIDASVTPWQVAK